jgi:hypothetical protein
MESPGTFKTAILKNTIPTFSDKIFRKFWNQQQENLQLPFSDQLKFWYG